MGEENYTIDKPDGVDKLEGSYEVRNEQRVKEFIRETLEDILIQDVIEEYGYIETVKRGEKLIKLIQGIKNLFEEVDGEVD